MFNWSMFMSGDGAEVYPLRVNSLPERKDIARYIDLCLSEGWGVFSSQADITTDYLAEPVLVDVRSDRDEANREAERLTAEFGYEVIDHESGAESHLKYFVNRVALRGVSVELSLVADYERT